MRTTLDLEKELLEDVRVATGERTTSRAVAKALEEFLYFQAVARLEYLAGKVEVDDNWRENEELELADSDTCE